MLFLLRLTFWITLIGLFLPSSREDNRRLITSAEQTVHDMRGFCQRNPQVCEDMRATMTALLAKFRNGAELLQTWLAHHEEGEEHPGVELASTTRRQGRNDPPPQPVTKWQDSLSLSDKQLPWRGPTGF